MIVPLLAGRGERLFDNLGDISENYRVDELVSSEKATHARLVRR
ncbi:hypothetical protein [Kribbella sp. VKM Ac-2568]|nr:hypothetical protein [Kribbella sp. VKM Ac-2568]TCM43564.1 hypothetical protein EV648_109183 [Kribbella sp. VKM Ac-2568]